MSSPNEDSIVVGIDGSECSEVAFRWALAEAKRSNRHLRLTHVWQWTSDIHIVQMPSKGVSDARRSGRSFLDRVAAEAERNDVRATTHLIEGSPPNALAESASGAAMLVVGSHGRSPLATAVLGSVSRGCLRGATCPVVVVTSGYRAADHPKTPEAATHPAVAT